MKRERQKQGMSLIIIFEDIHLLVDQNVFVISGRHDA